MANLNLNKVVLGGRLSADPEMRTTPNGTHTASFSIAINGRGKDAKADFIDVVVWRGNADTVCKYFKKGSSICVSGRLSTRSWKDANGIQRHKVEVIADDIIFVDGRNDNPALTEQEAVDEVGDSTATETVRDADVGDELPF